MSDQYLFTQLDDYVNAVAENPNTETVDLNVGDPEGFGHWVEKTPKTVDVNTLLNRVALNRNTRILVNEISTTDFYNRNRDNIETSRIQHLNHYILKEVENAFKLLIEVRNSQRRAHDRFYMADRKEASEKVIFNVLSNILHSDMPFCDKVSTILIITSMLAHMGLYGCRDLFPPFTVGEYKQNSAVIDLGIEVGDFKGASQSLKMKTDYPTIYSTLENFILLKDEINKSEEGLYEELVKVLNNMLSTTDLKDFIDSALIFYGKVSPYHYHTEFNRQMEEKKQTSELPTQPLARELIEQLNAKTMLSVYKLDCHCHSHSDDWKLRILPQIINYAFGMLTK